MDDKKVEEIAFRVGGDMGGSFVMALGYIGDRLGLFAALAGAGPLTSVQLATKTNLNNGMYGSGRKRWSQPSTSIMNPRPNDSL